jgi:replicative DNA helicase
MREPNVSAAARGLTDVSGELRVPVLTLGQLNRNRAMGADKRPQWPTCASQAIWKTRPIRCSGSI